MGFPGSRQHHKGFNSGWIVDTAILSQTYMQFISVNLRQSKSLHHTVFRLQQQSSSAEGFNAKSRFRQHNFHMHCLHT